MSVWLQFDSGARSNPYIFINTTVTPPNPCSDGNWFPNDSRYNPATQDTQTPTNYKVLYEQLNTHNNKRTLNYLAHCRERPENITYNVQFCVLTLPACTRVRIKADPVKGTPQRIVNVMDEPYLYVKVSDNNNSEGDLICTNNGNPNGGDQATFVVYNDRLQIGTDQDNAAGAPPGIPTPTPCDIDSANTYSCAVPQIIPTTGEYGYTTYRWAIYKSCMATVMRLDLSAQEWRIRIYDRYGNDLIVYEDDNACAGYPRNFAIDPCVPVPNSSPISYKPPVVQPLPTPQVQTMLLLGIKPNFDITSTDFNYGYISK